MKFDNIIPISDARLIDLYALARLKVIPIRAPAPNPQPPRATPIKDEQS